MHRGVVHIPYPCQIGCGGGAIFHNAENCNEIHIIHYSNLKCSNLKYSNIIYNCSSFCITLYITVNNDFKVVYNLKFQKQYSSTKSNYQSRQVTGCSQCSSIIFVIALALWMYEHAFIGRMTHMAKTTQPNIEDIVIRAGRTPPPRPDHAASIPAPIRRLVRSPRLAMQISYTIIFLSQSSLNELG